MLDEEYRKAVLEAELSWVRGIVDDLRDGRLTWTEEWLAQIAATFLNDNEEHEVEGS